MHWKNSPNRSSSGGFDLPSDTQTRDLGQATGNKSPNPRRTGDHYRPVDGSSQTRFNEIPPSEPPQACLEGRPRLRHPRDLHLHPALADMNWDSSTELNEAEQARHQGPAKPILVANDGTILSGFGRWQSALRHGDGEIACIEYQLAAEGSLMLILALHKPQRGWNAFVRTSLALTLEPHFQRQAVENMRKGGRTKGLANLPSAQRINVRRKIANVAGVGARNVSNVKFILKRAHPRLLAALRQGIVSINRVLGFCKLSWSSQSEALFNFLEDRATDQIIRRGVQASLSEEPLPDSAAIISALQVHQSHLQSIVIKRGRAKNTTIVVGKELWSEIHQQMGVSQT